MWSHLIESARTNRAPRRLHRPVDIGLLASWRGREDLTRRGIFNFNALASSGINPCAIDVVLPVLEISRHIWLP